MALAEDLLQQAREMAHLGARKPKQANLRRSISTAHYALFHLLVQDAAKRLTLKMPVDLSQQVVRAFAHGEMKQICKSLIGRSPAIPMALQPQGYSTDPQLIASTLSLQADRHAADYDLTQTYTRVEALNLVDSVQTAFLTWKRTRLRDEANIFCAALLVNQRWGR